MELTFYIQIVFIIIVFFRILMKVMKTGLLECVI